MRSETNIGLLFYGTGMGEVIILFAPGLSVNRGVHTGRSEAGFRAGEKAILVASSKSFPPSTPYSPPLRWVDRQKSLTEQSLRPVIPVTLDEYDLH